MEGAGHSPRSVALQGEHPAGRQLKLRMVGNSRPGPAAHSSREAVGGAETATRRQGHGQTRVPGNEPYPEPFLPARPVPLASSWPPPIPRAPSREQRHPWSPEDGPAWGRSQEGLEGQEDPARPKPLFLWGETGQGSRFLFCLPPAELSLGPGPEKVLNKRVLNGDAAGVVSKGPGRR